MKSLQMKYNFLHILYWITYCSVYGYVAVFLQFKGLSNTEIGIVTGVGAILSIFISPFISSLVGKIKGLTIKKLMLILYCLMVIIFASLVFLPLPTIIIMILYMSLTCLMVSNVPFLSMICTQYLKEGQYINFGLSRGLGSVSYAATAIVIGRMIDFINPTIIGYIHCISSILLLILLFSMPDSSMDTTDEKDDSISIFQIINQYKTFFFILVGFAFSSGASTSLTTYLIDIVKNLGGNTSLYGIAVFCMAASEMPFMAITHSLLKKYKSETLILAASLFYLARNFTICLAPSLPILLIGMMFQGCSYGLFTATITYYVNDYLDPKHHMMGQTMIGMMSTGLGSSIGNLCGGVLQDHFGLNNMLVFACTLTIIGVIIVFFTVRNKIGMKKRI